MRKVMALLLAVLMLVTVFAGCTNPDNGTIPNTDPSSKPSIEPTSPTASIAPTAPNSTKPTEPAVSNPTQPTVSTPTEPHSHSYSEWSVTQEATCTKNGIRVRSCDCGETQSEEIPATGHNYGDWTVTQEATCIETGIRSSSCVCGDIQTEEIPANGHNYVDSICTVCGKENFTNELRILKKLDVDKVYYCSENTIVFQNDNKSYLADHNGKILTEGYDYVTCANPDGYFVAYNRSSEVIATIEDPDFGNLDTTRYVYDCYVINEKGNIVFQTQYICTEADMDMSTYEGEYIASCNEDRIITYTADTYFFGMDHSALTVNIYDMQGNRLAQFKEVKEFGTLIGGKLVFLMDCYNDEYGVILVADKNGNVLHYGYECLPCDIYSIYFPSNYWTINGFIDGYVMLDRAWTGVSVLISEDLSKTYQIDNIFLANYDHIGTLVASKIVVGDTISDEYYLVDLAKCEIDESGYCIPTLDAAVSQQSYSEIYISCMFGEVEPYVLVSRDDQWGYLALDGSVEKLYTDAGNFYNGKAIVMDGDRIYVIDENFKQISNSITGYSTIYAYSGNVFGLLSGDKLSVAVYAN